MADYIFHAAIETLYGEGMSNRHLKDITDLEKFSQIFEVQVMACIYPHTRFNRPVRR
jgi:hypothetical protein